MSLRTDRVSQAVKQEVADILQKELKDPRVGFVTVTRVDVTPDLRQAHIYFSVIGEKTLRETEAGLKSAAGFVRTELGRRLRLRVTPELFFKYDKTIEQNIRMSKLLDEIREEGEGS
ncbi:MAG: ribosome-binding factor A [Candidatus Omnitrophica bacterium CG11_big_fil_rev_8_21_14_0_20_64_10]|nr:MAG: ribosome-binding factor A [Candidatus Omnitrophica bacterium CG11_big_fil_rev_8_21_14_0_20_64_10]